MVLAALVLLQAKAVPFDGPPMMASALLAKLSSATGEKLQLGTGMEDTGLFLHSKDLNLDEIKAGIADATWGQWKRQSGTWYLEPDTSRSRARDATQSREFADKVTKWLTSNPRGFRTTYGELEAAEEARWHSADTRFAMEFVRCISRAELQRMLPGKRTIFSTHPTSAERPLEGVHANEWAAGLVNEEYLKFQYQWRQRGENYTLGKQSYPPIATSHVIADGGGFTVIGYDVNGKIVIQTYAVPPYEPPLTTHTLSDLTDPNAPPIQPDPVAKQFTRLYGRMMRGGETETLKDAARALLDVDKFDPLVAASGPLLRRLAVRLGGNCVLAAPDSMSVGFDQLKEWNSSLQFYARRGVSPAHRVGRVTVIGYDRMVQGETLRINRSEARALYERAKSSTLQTEDIKHFLVCNFDPPFLNLFATVLCGSMGIKNDFEHLDSGLDRIFWGMPDGLRSQLLSGKRVAFSSLDASSRRRIQEYLYSGDTGLRSPSRHVGTEADSIRGTLAQEPTVTFPTFPSGAFLTGATRAEPQLSKTKNFRMGGHPRYFASQVYNDIQQGRMTLDGLNSSQFFFRELKLLRLDIDLGNDWHVAGDVALNDELQAKTPTAYMDLPKAVRAELEAEVKRILSRANNRALVPTTTPSRKGP